MIKKNGGCGPVADESAGHVSRSRLHRPAFNRQQALLVPPGAGVHFLPDRLKK
jgi:hypothetical protein